MSGIRLNVRMVGLLLLAVILLGAQLHLCAEFAAGTTGSHVCQVCATAGHAVVTQVQATHLTPEVCQLEMALPQGEVCAPSVTVTSPRAPPSL